MVDGALPVGVTAKDLILAIIGKIGTAGGTGHVIEYAGQAIRDLSMEGRMTICNMSIEGGARAGLIAPDETTYAYVKRSEEHTSELQSLMRISYAVFCLKKKKLTNEYTNKSPICTHGTKPQQ